MADSANIRTGLKSLMQDHLSNRLVSTLVNRMPLIAFLLAKDGNRVGVFGTGHGRPKTGLFVTGVPMSKTQRETVLNSSQYMPIVQTLLPAEADGKVMTMYDTVPQRANWTTTSPGSYVKRPFFRWVERADPIMVPKKEIRRTKRAAGNEGPKASAAVGDLFRFESDSVLSTHLNWFNKAFWSTSATQAPTNQDADVWDKPFSVRLSLKDDNVYGGVDRAVAANAFWKGKFITAHRAAVLSDLVHEANYTQKCADVGQGVELLICGADLMPQFIDEARAKGGTVVYDGKLPGIGEYGFTKEVVRFNNTYVVYDPQCPSKRNGDATNAVLGINLSTWTLAISPDANFDVDEPFDLGKTDGGKDAIKSQIRTEMIGPLCECPSVNIWWEDVG